jgi:hypothetical protein
MATKTLTQIDQLTHLFDIELKYTGRFSDAESAAGRVGGYIGSGTGFVKGSDILGRVLRWDLYEDVGEHLCRSNLSGTIETDDVARIRFDTMGFFRIPDKSQPRLWATSAAVYFETDDGRYAWLNEVLGVWEGTFDMDAYQHHYQVYARMP